MPKDRSREQSALKFLEGSLTIRVKDEGYIMSSEVNQWFSNDAVFPNESPVEIIKAKEGLNALDRPGWLLVSDDLDLLGVDLDAVYTNDKSKILCLLDAELAFLDVRLKASVYQAL